MFTTTSTHRINRFQYAATLLGALAVVVMAPATAHAQPVGPAGSGCHYTDKDGYDIPIDDGQAVIVDGKTVSCSGGTITVSAAPSRGNGVNNPVLTGKLPVLNRNAVVTATP
ncbi:MAG: hypothetical protein M3O32_13365 [Actinomycetota bacterium]|nr:hypothetical protein [Actinomycetota bacterium]